MAWVTLAGAAAARVAARWALSSSAAAAAGGGGGGEAAAGAAAVWRALGGEISLARRIEIATATTAMRDGAGLAGWGAGAGPGMDGPATG